jgi:SAM-dependent methyltransferase
VGPFEPETVRRTYDMVAEEYADAFGDDLERLPFDRSFLDDFASQLTRDGPVVDVGCGPGQVGAYIADHRGVQVIGLDLAPRTLQIARRRRGLTAVVSADLRHIPLRSGSCGGVVAFYSLPFLPRDHLLPALGELRRVLRPGGTLGLATHLGQGEVYGSDEWLGHRVERIGVTLFEDREIDDALAEVGFRTEETRCRGPLPHEHQGPRIYVLAARDQG